MKFKSILSGLLTAWVIVFFGLTIISALFDAMDSTVFGIAIIALAGLILLVVTRRSMRRDKKATDGFNEPISKKMLAHYQQAGLSDAEIDVFRETMSDAKKEIVELEQTMQAVPKLRAINLNHDTIGLTKAMFSALVNEPERLQEAADFLYKHLPTSLTIAKKYQEISQHEMKTSDTYAVLDRSVEMLASLSEQIKQDYLDYVHDDVSELESTLDGVDKEPAHPDFNITNDRSIAQMQDQLNQIQADYLEDQQTKTTDQSDHDPDQGTQDNKDGEDNNDR
ncbi:5-bromo-4-chloroindolyl phosphate hydrolysis family protein [Lapidilactobacillus salsurivasis]